MRIYLDARNITAQPAGVARYAKSLIPELCAQAPEHDFVVIRHRSNMQPLMPGRVPWREVFLEQHIGKVRDVALGARALFGAFRDMGRPDVYHNLFHISPLGVSASGARHVVTLHDFIWVDHPLQSQGALHKAAWVWAFGRTSIAQTIKNADRVIAISDATSQRAQQWISPKKIHVIGHGVEEKYYDSYPAPELPWSEDAGYILGIANDKPYKNLELVIDAFHQARGALPGVRLVLVGRCDGLRKKIQRLGLSSRVHLPGHLSEEQLLRLLHHARAFVYPSLVEGFGLPPLEAMAMGVPTITSDLDPMRHVVGQGALVVDPHDAQALARTFEQLWHDEQLVARLRQAGPQRARQWSWARTARQTLEVYKGLHY